MSTPLSFFLVPLMWAVHLHPLAGQVSQPVSGRVFATEEGTVAFRSEAPLELIQARSDALKGAIDLRNGTFAFSMLVASFEGFNSPLQREHFKENYLETSRYPRATFKGTLIESLAAAPPGTYTVRAKGILSIHGVSQERIIRATVVVGQDRLEVRSDFSVRLDDHSITIPRIVHQKIAQEIDVHIKAVFLPQAAE
ncbi:MAG: YceI family protein [Bacteroidia bacterium]